MRNRTTSSFSNGSMCMSLALSLIAWENIEFTSLIIGASSVTSKRSSGSSISLDKKLMSSSFSSSTASSALFISLLWSLFIKSMILFDDAMQSLTLESNNMRRSSISEMFKGSDVATSTAPFSLLIGRSSYFFA